MSNGTPGYRPRSFFLPLLMVLIGTYALFTTMGWGHLPGFWITFAHYWPLLLILWGVLKLVEHVWARQKGLPASGIGAGSVVFIVFFVLFGMFATKVSGVNWSGMGMDVGDFDPFNAMGGSHEFTENFSQDLKTGTQVRVVVAHGSVSVTSSPDGQAHAFVHKYLRAYSDDEAGKTNEASHPKMVQQGDLWLLDLTGGPYSQGRFDLDLQLPPALPVTLSTSRGDLHVTQRTGDVTLDSSHGDLTAEDVKANVSLRPHRGDVTVKNVTGNVTIDGYVSDVTVADIKGTVVLTGTYLGEMQMSNIEKQVRFNSTRTDLQFAGLPGELTIERSGMRGSRITGPFRLDARGKDIHLEEVEGDIHIENNRGEVDVKAATPTGAIDISNQSGDITVGLPEKPGFQMDAKSDTGEIHSDFPLEIKNDPHNATATGTVGKGPIVRLKTKRGTIQINKL